MIFFLGFFPGAAVMAACACVLVGELRLENREERRRASEAWLQVARDAHCRSNDPREGEN